MDEQTLIKLNRLKHELYMQKEQINRVGDLVREDIDRDYPTDLWELSERELDNEMGNRLSFLNEDIDPRRNLDIFVSHRRFLGKPIRFIKRKIVRLIDFYIDAIMARQAHFNEQVVAFQLATFIRARHNERAIQQLAEKIKNLDDELQLILDQSAGSDSNSDVVETVLNTGN